MHFTLRHVRLDRTLGAFADVLGSPTLVVRLECRPRGCGVRPEGVARAR
jgi:hypothetical protein